MIRVLLIDDHTLLREGLKRILAEAPEVRDVGEAGDGPEALAKLAQSSYEVAVLDISLPGMDGIELLKRIRRQHPRTAALILTMYPEAQYASRALRAGAAGYLTKDRAAEDLLAAVRKLATGGRFITDSVAERLAEEVTAGTARPPHELLSDRELQVLRELAAGKTVREIGAELGLSSKTVSTYRTRVLQKTGLSRNAELVRYALANRLLG